MRPRGSRAVRALALGLAFAALPPVPRARAADGAPPATARAGWNEELADLCAKTQDAMSLADDELRILVARCDELRPVIEQLPGPERKVYSRRLQGCRDLYQFVLDSRAAKGSG